MLRVLLLLLLLIPVAELASLFWLAHQIGAWTWLYLLCTTLIGIGLLKSLRLTVMLGMLQSAQSGASPIGALFYTARQAIAGMLFLIPGLFTDVLAILLLLPWPASWMPKPMGFPDASSPFSTQEDPHVMDGEFQRVDENRERLPPR
ncbi:FxsA family protein [Leeia oryzae]|uniref:FxsA family protein n=1 Tax=Leeia oryzae TaxID=356662 RepID=UPI000476EBBB|nr:FxsA family protein [Leeia oryzae]